MKKIIIAFCMSFSIFGNAQNSFDPYDLCTPTDVSVYLDHFDMYTGEYQIFLQEGSVPHYWTTRIPLQNNAISYKVELVSFPFTTNCVNCYGTGAVNATDRVLKMPDNTTYPYDPLENAWIRNGSSFPAPPLGATYEVRLLNKYEGEYGIVGGYSDPSSLISIMLIGTNNIQYIEPNRKLYPHSVLKHTLYMHCSSDATTPKVDSFSFVLDHTRGRMRNYPFCEFNNSTTGNREYDIGIVPSIIDGSYDPSYPSYSLFDLIDYFPHAPYDNICQDHIPEDISTALPLQYIRPAPYSQVQTILSNAQTDNAAGLTAAGVPLDGIAHEYIIDRPIDLTIINPSEKIIYNPSEVSIDLNLTGTGQVLIFPSGYTFKTVSGIYPTQAQVAAADPNNLYLYDIDNPVTTTLACDDVGANEGVFSYYYVKSGSTLNIMPCVNIYDTKIIVETGATVNYDANSLRGNYSIVSTGGTINSSAGFPSPVSCRFDCFDKQRYDDKAGDIHVSSNQTWSAGLGGIPLTIDVETDGIIRISGALVIDANVTLNISGPVRFEFGENGKIVIEPTGKLIVNGNPLDPAIFTSADFCELGMWNGIEVRGNRALGQAGLATTPQGYVKMINAKISNARNAFATRKEGNGWDFNGGIIQCQNVEFLNNRRSAEFLSYHNISPSGTEIRNLSYFKDCKFFVTDYLNDKKYMFADGRRLGSENQVSMWDVMNVRFDNCLFENKALQSDGITPLLNTDQRGSAIFAIDAAIGLAGGTAKNTFKGFSDAVWAISSGDSDFISIVGNVFENNVNGIVLEGTSLSRINQNTFLVPAHTYNLYALAPSYNSGYNKPVGLYLIGATDFTAEENIFTNYGPPSTDGIPLNEYNYGMVVNNCTGDFGEGTGSAYKNVFSNLNIGLQAELNNKGNTNAGLQYKCNEYTSRVSYDATVVGTSSLVGSLRNQGACINSEDQAGNSYTSCPSGSEVQLKFDYDAWYYSTGFMYSDQSGELECPTDLSYLSDCNAALGMNACSSNISNCSSIPCILSSAISSAAEAVQSLAEYKSLLDGGNTANLITQINSNITAGALKNLLMSKSPYLSDAVLLAMLNRTDMVPPGHLEQVSIANSPLAKPVMDAVENMALPGGVLNNIRTAQVGVSARSEKENEVSYNEYQAKLAEVKVKQAYLEIDNLDSLKIVALKDTTLAGLFKLLEVLIAKGDLAEAQTCRSLIISKEGTHITDRCKLLSTRLNLALAGKSWFDMSSTQANLVTQIYNNNPATAINARAVLALTKGLKYERYPFDINQSRKMRPFAEEHIKKEGQGQIKVYPNPGAEQTSVEVNFPGEVREVQLEIYDLLGAKVFIQTILNKETTVIETKELNNGIYFFVLKTEDGKMDKQKVIISK
jgi:hypothetical protein